MRALVFALCVCLAACAAGARKSAVPAPEAAPAEAAPAEAGSPGVLPDSQRDEITKLEAQIDADRTKLLIPELAPTDYARTAAEPMGTPVPTQDPKCRPGKSETCTTSCTLSDSICGNAEKICKLAVEVNDDWARGKCAKANQTCEASRTKCCGCS